MSPRLTFALLVSIAVIVLAGSSAATPLYAIYQAHWGFSPITITIVFGVYTVAVLAALLTVGSISDFVGRRPVVLIAIALQVVAMIVFATATGVPALIVARIIQGVSTGAVVGAVGAAMLDLDRTKGTIANAVAPATGTAIGGIVSGLMVQYLPGPTHTIYLVLLAILVAQGIGVWWMPESSPPKPGALASLRPRFRLPPAVRAPMFLAVPALVAAWALAGFYLSLGPTLVHRLVGSSAIALGGLSIFVFAGSGATTVLILRERTPRALATLGSTALLAGVAITLVAIAAGSVGGFFVGTSIAGMGFGSAFQGAIRTVVALSPPRERAGVLSLLFTISYLAMGVPALFAGFRVVHGNGVLATAREYGATVMVLAAVALVGTRVRRPRVAPVAVRG